MKAISYHCDRCGDLITGPITYKIIGHQVDKDTEAYLSDEGNDLDFCPQCFSKILSDLTDNIKDDLEEEEPEEEKTEDDPVIKEKIRRRPPTEKTYELKKEGMK